MTQPLWLSRSKEPYSGVEGLQTVAGENDTAILGVLYVSANHYRRSDGEHYFTHPDIYGAFQHLSGTDQRRTLLEPSEAVRLWKAAYGARTPTGTNFELMSLTDALAYTMIRLVDEPASFANPRSPLLVYFRSGIAEQCHRIISADTFLDEHPFFIWRMLAFFTAICASCLRVDIIPPNFRAHFPSREDVVMMSANFWENASTRREIFIDGGHYDRVLPGSTSKLRENLQNLLGIFSPIHARLLVNEYDLKVMNLEHLRRLLLLAWFYGPVNRPDDAGLSDLMLQLACPLWSGYQLPSGDIVGVSGEEVINFFDRDVISVYGAVPFLARLRTTLQSIQEGNQDVAMTNLRDVSRGLVHPVFRPYLIPSGVLEVMMCMFKKRLDSSLLDTNDMTSHTTLFPCILPFLHCLSKDDDNHALATVLIRDYDLMLWIASGLLLTARLGAKNITNVSDIIRTYQGITLQLKREDRTKATYGLLVSSLRQVWYGTLATLYELQAHTYASERDGLIVIWRRFGVAAGLDEKVEMRRATHLCSRIYCRHHFFFTEKPTPTCKGCGTVRYCSKECQKSDWKDGGHKEVCRRLK